jgi:release factor glutamine methyltransferase
VAAVDIDKNCLDVARINAGKYKTSVQFFLGNLIEPLTEQLNASKGPCVLLCNLPYVPDSFHINEAALHEPRSAIFGGPDGLDPYKQLFEQIDTLKKGPQFILTESLPTQHHLLATMARHHGYIQIEKDDFIQLFSN